MENRKKFITGATGYVGQRLVRTLAGKGFSVYALSRRETELFADLANVQVIIGDITGDIPFPPGIETIYHCAGVIRNEEAMERVNVEGTRNIVALALQNDCALVYLSSAGIVGKTSLPIVDEQTPCHPHNAYEISKYKAEEIVTRAVKKGLRAQILRPTTIFGAGMNPKNNSFLGLVRSMRNGSYRNIGKGGMYNIIHVDEVVAALELLDNVAHESGGIYAINNPIAYGAMDMLVKNVPPPVTKKTQSIPYFVAVAATILLSVLSLILRKQNPLTFSRLRALTNKSVYSSEKLKETFSFTFEKNTAEHINETCKTYIDHGVIA